MLTLPVLLISSVVCGSAAPDLDNGVLDFTAKWCGPCQEMSPLVSKLERAGLPIHKVDIDQNQKLSKKYGVTRIPTFLLVINGKVVKQLTGPQSEETLRQLCAQVPASGRSAEEAAPALTAPDSRVALNDANRGGFGRGGTTPFVPAQPDRRSRDETERAKGELVRGQSPGKPKSAVPVITNQPFPATVRIRVKDASGDDVGTGTIIYNGDEQAIILTCGHLFKHWDDKTSRLMIEVFERGSGKVVPGRKIAVDADGDVALISIPTDKPLPSCPLAARGTKPQKSTSLVSVGCNGGDPPTVEQHKVVALNRYKGPDNLECTGIPVRGRSGGGLFNQAGEVVGVCMAEDPNYKDGMYAGLEPVYRLLASSRLSHLFEGVEPAATLLADQDPANRAELGDDDLEDLAAEDEDPTIAGIEPPEDDTEEPPAESGDDGDTQKILQKALALARKGDIVCVIPREDDDPTLGSVLVIHEPGDELRRTLAGGPDSGAIRSASFRGLPPADVRAQMKRPAKTGAKPLDSEGEEMREPPTDWEDDLPDLPPTPRNPGSRGARSGGVTESVDRASGGFRRGRPMSLRGKGS